MGDEKGVLGRGDGVGGQVGGGWFTRFGRWGGFFGPRMGQRWVEPVGRGKYEITEDGRIVVEVFGGSEPGGK